MQPKLLRFLETREVHPLGEPHPVAVDVRIIAATNASLEKLVAEGRFREDLFYRLNVVRLKLPPLRERREEIPPLVFHYLRRFGDEQKKGRLTLSDEALEYLLLFSWPGNVRQLANEIRRVVAMIEPDTTITPAMLSPDIQASRRTVPATAAPEAEVRLTLDQPLPAAVHILEQMMVRRALARSHGRVEEASRILGISRKGLFLKRRRLGMRESLLALAVAAEERRNRHVAHGVQSGSHVEDLRERVDHDRRGRDVAVDAAGNLGADGGQPEDLHRVVRFRRAEVRLHVQRDDRLAVPVADAVLDDAADVAGIDREELARDRRRRHLRLDLVGDAIQLPAHARRQSSTPTRPARHGGRSPSSTFC